MKRLTWLVLPVVVVFPIIFHLLREPLGLAGVLALFALIAGVRLLTLPWLSRSWRVAAAAALTVFLGSVLVADSAELFKLYPAALNALLLGACAYTLWHPPSAVERLMRALGVTVSEAGIGYTRAVTAIWCMFFAANCAVAAYTALAASTEIWALYNGALSYLVAMLLLGGEYLYRGRFRRRVARRDYPAT